MVVLRKVDLEAVEYGGGSMRADLPNRNRPTALVREEDRDTLGGKSFLAKIYGEWHAGPISPEWYGFNFTNWGTSGIQIDGVEELYEIVEEAPR